jgi:hypothetical protein
MSAPVVTIPLGGAPMIEALHGRGTPFREALNKYGTPISLVAGTLGTPFVFVTDIPLVLLFGNSVPEDAAIGTTVGTLAAQGVTGTPVYSLTDSAGGRFSVTGNSIKVAGVLDYETTTYHDIIVAVAGVAPVMGPFTYRIYIIDVLEVTGDITALMHHSQY